ncbi:MAG: type II secretion system protein, partial [Bdellovibrionota bacterium]
MKQNSAGFSLMELMVAIAVSGVLTYAIISLIKEGTSAQKTLQAQDDARTLTDNFAMLLADTKACTN